ncbi:hypothetical protein PUNSTDRAFT_125617 [Punctularia strigosozonata HHB-11173 SS5]|uniref:uncharacterized protein n=1 Tax=Punctularia strigosozonata (strain HHB-11173) TaxID=741275 RepID=UPI00044171B1|nr:uncharacterized protein PUNSTDRAFT_125617 [Punctularia strigosozonata HHB-11173 SS5]EIN11065.1 hypothetical protein PUNSTDRAFT_125617 [Punctularia strigosozonata HHB-11173 SS5]
MGSGRSPRPPSRRSTLGHHRKSSSFDADAVEVLELPVPVQSASAVKKKSARILDGSGPSTPWTRFKRRRLGTGTAPSTSSLRDESGTGTESLARVRTHVADPDTEPEDDAVDEVVVDREWLHEIMTSVVSPSESGAALGAAPHGGAPGGTTVTDAESDAYHTHGLWGCCSPLVILRYRVWPAIFDFFCLRFHDDKSETQYKKENWFMRKSLAVWSSLFLVVNWVFATAFDPPPRALADEIFYYGVETALTLPILFMVMYDWPRDRPKLYQIFLSVQVWSWSFYQVAFMYACGFYRHPERHTCGTKDFIGTFYYTTAIPTIALFGLKLNRFPMMLGAVAFFGVSSALVLPFKTTWYRNLLNFALFHVFLLYVHYMRENAERRLYTLRDQLKVQFKATQKAQVNERKTADSKRRLTSYVFHEVRVPLNTALLATQNIAASGSIQKEVEIEFKALEGSLSMMSKVLNDVLDFNRMDSGRFESVHKPYRFHETVNSLLVPLRLATDARGLRLVTSLDPAVDRAARRAAYEAMGYDPATVTKMIEEHPDEDGVVVGDEMRLRQIITNLSSNACKFTPTGGTVSVTTKLLWPAGTHTDAGTTPSETVVGSVSMVSPLSSKVDPSVTPSPRRTLDEKHVARATSYLSAGMLDKHNKQLGGNQGLSDQIIVRIEVTDTGCGIQSKDMLHNKLFSAFNQTEMGRQQGGKGTGLGLALVRQIVKRSGGRLGVRSKAGQGSTFWVELPLGVGPKALEPNHQLDHYLASPLSYPVAKNPRPSARTNDGDHSRSTMNTLSSISATENVSQRERPPSFANSASALHGIMDQGGLVELRSPGDNGSTTSVPTRTIGDPSTGTAPAQRTPPEIHAPVPTAAEKSALVEESSSQTVIPTRQTRPRSIELPRRTPASLGQGGALSPVPSVGIEGIPDALHERGTSAPEPAASPVSSHSQASETFDPGLHVLIVDDDPLTRQLMRRMLQRLGCVVSTAENGEVALELLLGSGYPRPTPSDEGSPPSVRSQPGADQSSEREGAYAVVFLDNQMPVCSGLEAIARLRSAGRRDFVVGVTGNALLSDQDEYLDAGVDQVLTKPVLEKSLKSMLVMASRKRRKS